MNCGMSRWPTFNNVREYPKNADVAPSAEHIQMDKKRKLSQYELGEESFATAKISRIEFVSTCDSNENFSSKVSFLNHEVEFQNANGEISLVAQRVRYQNLLF